MKIDFPILNGGLIYLDNASTTQKPYCVIEAISNFYRFSNSNVHRGVYSLSEKATEAYEGVRDRVAKFLNASSRHEIIFTKGTTEGINLVASSFGSRIKKGDEILVSEMEHHSNIVPWQILCEKTGAKLRVVPMNIRGELDMEKFRRMLNKNTKLVAVVHVSNSLGTINPVKKIVAAAHAKNIPVLVDAAQSVQHMKIDVQDLDCDFLVFSGHKIYGPTGIGVLYGKEKILEKLPPYQGGGDMILKVTFKKTIYNVLPYKFEAGTPNIEGVIGLGAAIHYIEKIGWDKISAIEEELLEYASSKFKIIRGLKIIGNAKMKGPVISFVIEGIHPHDIGTFLDNEKICVRTGQHCTEPVMDKFKIPATTRVSFAVYNSREEIDVLVVALEKLIKVFNGN
ncbi:MAG: cysteine desulfurase [Patescibacteria group bacterium]